VTSLVNKAIQAANPNHWPYHLHISEQDQACAPTPRTLPCVLGVGTLVLQKIKPELSTVLQAKSPMTRCQQHSMQVGSCIGQPQLPCHTLLPVQLRRVAHTANHHATPCTVVTTWGRLNDLGGTPPQAVCPQHNSTGVRMSKTYCSFTGPVLVYKVYTKRQTGLMQLVHWPSQDQRSGHAIRRAACLMLAHSHQLPSPCKDQQLDPQHNNMDAAMRHVTHRRAQALAPPHTFQTCVEVIKANEVPKGGSAIQLTFNLHSNRHKCPYHSYTGPYW
jgi:hypothetical protein